MALSYIVVALACIAYYIHRYYKNVARYPPGPTPLPLIGNILQLDKTNIHKCFERMSATYGPVFTVFLPRPTVIITKLPEIKEALVKKGDVFAGRPSNPVDTLFTSFTNGGIIFSENEFWRDQRRYALHTLRNFGMGRNLMEEKVMSSVATMYGQVDDLAQQDKADMNWPLQLCVGNIINELLFGYHFPVNDCAKFVYMKEGLENVFFRMRNRITVRLIQAHPWLRHLPVIGWNGYGEMRADTMKIINFVGEEITDHKKDLDYDAEPCTFTAAYLQEIRKREQNGNTDSYSELQLANVLTDFWIAGMETTATTLRWTIVLLVAHPEVQARLQKEIDDVIGPTRQPKMADKTNMPYTSAVLMELQRKANILPFNVLHMTLAETEVANLPIPARTAVLAQISSVLDDPDTFPQPERFNPDRFLNADGKTFNTTAVDHLVPFSLGKRQCAGESLARMELFLILVALMQRYTLSVPEGGQLPDLKPVYGATQLPRPYQCKITLRHQN
uniref:Cytochrome P450 n=1 Tax=Plectus sambesii TaxID=2011161 RepID=A0A914VFF7_9BILA